MHRGSTWCWTERNHTPAKVAFSVTIIIRSYRRNRRHGTKVDKDGGGHELNGTVTDETTIGAVIGRFRLENVEDRSHVAVCVESFYVLRGESFERNEIVVAIDPPKKKESQGARPIINTSLTLRFLRQ